MKIALFSAIPEEAGPLANLTNNTGIGRENATRSCIEFIERHKNEKFTILNIGTVGSHDKPVGTILSIHEIISAGEPFNEKRMLPANFNLHIDKNIETATLYSSDCFVSPEVFTDKYLETIKQKADCFDMESSAVFTIAQAYGIPFISYKIVSDNLDVDLEEWKMRVNTLSLALAAHIQLIFDELKQTEEIEFLQ